MRIKAGDPGSAKTRVYDEDGNLLGGVFEVDTETNYVARYDIRKNAEGRWINTDEHGHPAIIEEYRPKITVIFDSPN